MIINKTDANINYQIAFASLFVSIILLPSQVMQILDVVFVGKVSIGYILLPFSIVSLILFCRKLRVVDCILIIAVLSFFAFSYLFSNNEYLPVYFNCFAVYGSMGLIYSYCQIDEEKVLRNCFIIEFVWLVLFVIKNGLQVTNTFSFGYLLYPFVALSFMSLFGKSKLKFFKVLLFVLLCVLLLINSSRGPIMCFALFVLVYIFQFTNKVEKKAFFIIAIVALAFIVLNAGNIIVFLHTLFPGKSSFIEKSYLLLSLDQGITNGRTDIIGSIFSEYDLTDWIFGIGIGKYASTHPDVEYTHNLFFSIALEFGVLGLGYIIVVISHFFKHIYKNNSNYLVFLFAVSIIQLTFSGVFWKAIAFWPFVFVMNKIIKQKNNNDNKSMTK